MIQTHRDIFFDRRSVKEYDPAFKLTQDELSELINKANQAPSAWNLQHWKYLVIHSDEAKAALLPIAFHQQQIADSSATVVILADREAHKQAEPVFSRDVAEGRMTEEIKALLTKQIDSAYAKAEYRFESGVLNASLAAMQLMNAATLAGLGTCPIGGFKRTELIRQFNIEERYLPLMLITIGRTRQEPRATARLSVKETATFL
ncbi:nitroreductase family protein [Macrococcus equipercicus]|uniref:Nitroreductase family protein n=1 Tax=Macrococcus equipercicus TaxID=69967 RepID=A0ABQ6R7W1_9STAP|nr:nitroreductase family protein [Macrococcus equipercicus]KAA1039180.1 nitroreductase family protein [Macrococcus equipercicus]